MFTQANPWNMNLDPLGTLRGNPNYCLSSSSSSMLRLLLHFRPRATKEVKENLTSIQRTRVMVISYQNIPRRTKRFEGAETRVWVSQVALVEKNPPAKAEDIMRHGFDSWVRKIPWRRTWQPTLVFLLGKSHRKRSLVDYSPWGHKE